MNDGTGTRSPAGSSASSESPSLLGRPMRGLSGEDQPNQPPPTVDRRLDDSVEPRGAAGPGTDRRASREEIERIRARVPAELIALVRWVAWDGTRLPNGKLSKTPLNPHTGRNAQSNNSSTWASFDAAAEFALRGGRCGGLGLVLTNSDYWALDLDHVVDNTTGELAPTAALFLRSLPPTYAEMSPGGDGIHVIFSGKRPDSLNRTRATNAFGDGKHLEVFGGSSSRYLTMTGLVWDPA